MQLSSLYISYYLHLRLMNRERERERESEREREREEISSFFGQTGKDEKVCPVTSLPQTYRRRRHAEMSSKETFMRRSLFLSCLITMSSFVLARDRETPRGKIYEGDKIALPVSGSRTLSGLSIYVAANFFNNDHTVAHFGDQMLKLAHHVGSDNLFVSVYESGSNDDTAELLSEVDERLRAANVSTSIVSNGKNVRDGRQRIDYLASMRNELLKPLRRIERSQKFDYVLFVNDVFLRAEDVFKLVAIGGDMACGIDYELKSEKQEGHHWNQQSPAANNLVFYDTWVARSERGFPLQNRYPHIMTAEDELKAFSFVSSQLLSHPQYLELLDAMGTSPLPWPQAEVQPVQCCWNGVTLVRAAPFYAGLTFRSNLPSRCIASEISHLCNDIAEMGYDKIAMHHCVRVAYTRRVMRLLRRGIDRKLYSATDLPLRFESAPVTNKSVCCGYSPDQDLSLRGPFDACRLEPTDGITASICLADPERQIPLKITQIGDSSAYRDLTPLTWTWRHLHPDHEYRFYSWSQLVDTKYHSDIGNISWAEFDGPFRLSENISLKSVLDALMTRGMFSLMRDLGKYALLYEHGGLYADLDTVASKSLSCFIAPSDKSILALDEMGNGFSPSPHEFGTRASAGIAGGHLMAFTRFHPLLKKLVALATKDALRALLLSDSAHTDGAHSVNNVLRRLAEAGKSQETTSDNMEKTRWLSLQNSARPLTVGRPASLKNRHSGAYAHHFVLAPGLDLDTFLLKEEMDSALRDVVWKWSGIAAGLKRERDFKWYETFLTPFVDKFYSKM